MTRSAITVRSTPMLDLGTKVNVTNELCAVISCIAYPSLIEANRSTADDQGISLPNYMIKKVNMGPGRAEYFVCQQIVDEIRNNITEVSLALYSAYDRFDSEEHKNLDLSLLARAVSNIDIAAETRWTEDHVRFGIRRLNTKIGKSAGESSSKSAGKTTHTTTNSKPTTSITLSGTRTRESTFDEPIIKIDEPVVMPSLPVVEKKSDFGIQELQNALPSNEEAAKVIQRFETILDMGYSIEVYLRSGHVLVKSFDPKQDNKPLGQVFIDSKSGLVTSEY